MTEDLTPLPTLHEIADFLDAHGRDDGGLSDKDRAWFAAAASAARRALPSGGDTEADTRRLNWLDAHGEDIRVSSGTVRVWHQQGSTEPKGDEKRKSISLREAIDAALSAPTREPR